MAALNAIFQLMRSILRKGERHHHAREHQERQYIDDDSAKDFDLQELALSTVTERRFCDQHDMSSQTATGRSLP